MTAPTGALWLTASGQSEVNDATEAAWLDAARALMNSTHLVVLAGSGCSYGLKGRGKDAPMMADLLALVKGLPGYTEVTRLHPDLATIDDVEELLSAVQAAASLASTPGPEADLLRDSTAAIRAACDFVDSSTNLLSHEMLIRKLANRDSRQERLTLFTTNYDLAFESALGNSRVMAIDGFGYGSTARFSGTNFQQDIVLRGARGELELAPNVVRLLKLHGSVDWDERPEGIYRSPSPANPVLIYPSANKYRQSYRQPYLEAMARLQACLRQPETSLITVGFGFNDDHVTQPIVDALMGEPTLRLLVVAPDVLTSSGPAFTRLRDAATAGDNRIGLLATTLSNFARLIPDRSGKDQWQATQDALARIWAPR